MKQQKIRTLFFLYSNFCADIHCLFGKSNTKKQKMNQNDEKKTLNKLIYLYLDW